MTVKTPKERPILFSATMVRAILDGRKTQTRRVVKDNHLRGGPPEDYLLSLCPYGQRGDRLWVRESFRFGRGYDGIKSSEVPKEDYVPVWYEADAPHSDVSVGAWVLGRYRPSIHMPRWVSRITLKITGVRVERLQDISEGDAHAEGADPVAFAGTTTFLPPIPSYRTLWEHINGDGSWDANPWVWVIEFELAEIHSVTP